MSAINWTPTGRMRWIEKNSGYRILQQLLEKDGFKNQWVDVPVVKSCKTCDGNGTINGGLGESVLCPICMGERTQ